MSERYIKRLVVISKCEECTNQSCAIRVMCGAIPDKCPLPRDANSLIDYALEHQSRSYRSGK